MMEYQEIKSRQRLPPETVRALESVFQMNAAPSASVIQELSAAHKLDVNKVKIWFNNRKAKEKRLNATEKRMPQYPSHVLTTTGGQFSIDETPMTFTYEMFVAMRERIMQLEHHIAMLTQRREPLTKRLTVAAGQVQGHLFEICQRLRQETIKRKFNFDDVVEVTLYETMSVDEFVVFFDEKGGIARELPGENEQDSLISVEFPNPTSVQMLIGQMLGDLIGVALINNQETRVSCTVQSLNVLYNKYTGRVSMGFHLVVNGCL